MSVTVEQSGSGWADVLQFPLDRVRRSGAENDPDDSGAEGTVFYLRTRLFALVSPTNGDVSQLPPAA